MNFSRWREASSRTRVDLRSIKGIPRVWRPLPMEDLRMAEESERERERESPNREQERERNRCCWIEKVEGREEWKSFSGADAGRAEPEELHEGGFRWISSRSPDAVMIVRVAIHSLSRKRRRL